MEAVLDYTQADKIDIISHSMGVTLGRAVIKGGYFKSADYNLGAPLTDKVDTFLGIVGANYGLASCYGSSQYIYDTCNSVNGFFPGYSKNVGLSQYLDELNNNIAREGSFVATVLSTYDDLILYGDIVYGRYTS